nr:MAG TPA: hypothetical protein [Caudoviricetes sp.]
MWINYRVNAKTPIWAKYELTEPYAKKELIVWRIQQPQERIW